MSDPSTPTRPGPGEPLTVEERLRSGAEAADQVPAATALSGLLRDAASTIDALRQSLVALRTELSDAQRAKLDVEAFLERRGYRRCDIPACNCNQWHQGHAENRLGEISDSLADAGIPGGTTIHGGVLLLIQRAATAEAQRTEAEQALAGLKTWAQQGVANSSGECGHAAKWVYKQVLARLPENLK